MGDNKNTVLAIVLSGLVLLAWQYFVGIPQMERQRQEAALKQQQPQVQVLPGTTPTPATAPAGAPQLPGQSGPTVAQQMSRRAALDAAPRIEIATPSLQGTISLKGGRIDDLSLVQYRETVDPESPAVELLSPSGSPAPFYAELGWV